MTDASTLRVALPVECNYIQDTMNKNFSTNTELIVDLMTYSKWGALGQAFVVEAIRDYAKRQINAAAWADTPNSMGLRQETWQAIARDVEARCEAFYGRSREEAA